MGCHKKTAAHDSIRDLDFNLRPVAWRWCDVQIFKEDVIYFEDCVYAHFYKKSYLKGTSPWLTSKPIEEHDFIPNKQSLEALALIKTDVKYLNVSQSVFVGSRLILTMPSLSTCGVHYRQTQLPQNLSITQAL